MMKPKAEHYFDNLITMLKIRVNGMKACSHQRLNRPLVLQQRNGRSYTLNREMAGVTLSTQKRELTDYEN